VRASWTTRPWIVGGDFDDDTRNTVIGVDVDGEGRVRERVCWEERCYGIRIVILGFLLIR
jgi:hypothetical protein